MDVEGFLERFEAIACNFKWQFLQSIICAYRGKDFFDPIQALILITKGDYIGRHELLSAKKRLEMNDQSSKELLRALYYPDKGDTRCMDIRHRIEKACGLSQE